MPRRWVCLEQDEKVSQQWLVQQFSSFERRRWGAGCICTKVNLCKSESLEHGPGMVSPACSRCHKSRVSVSQSLHLPLKYFLLFLCANMHIFSVMIFSPFCLTLGRITYVLLENTRRWLSTISHRFAGAQSGPSQEAGHE